MSAFSEHSYRWWLFLCALGLALVLSANASRAHEDDALLSNLLLACGPYWRDTDLRVQCARDLMTEMESLGTCSGTCPGDINGDGVVGGPDFLLFKELIGTECED